VGSGGPAGKGVIVVRMLHASVAPEASTVVPASWRRAGHAWALLSIVTATVAAMIFADSAVSYVAVLIVLASGAFTTPALVVGWWLIHQGPPEENPGGRAWYLGLVLIYVSGLALLAGLVDGVPTDTLVGVPLVVLIIAAVTVGNIRIVRSGSGQRALTIDGLDCLACVAAVVGPCALLWADDVVAAPHAWFAAPAAVVAVGTLAGLFWMVLLATRRRGQASSLGAVLLGFTGLGTVNAVAQAAQGVADFTLPGPPLVALHATWMACILVVPLHVPRQAPVGLGRLAPHAQVRGGAFPAAVALLAVLGMAGAAAVEGFGWRSGTACAVVASLLLALLSARQALTTRETRRLYRQLAEASAQRHALLDAVLRGESDDRHRVAATLHSHAASAYVAFVTFMQLTASDERVPAAAADVLRTDLAHHVDALRDLAAAVSPSSRDSPGYPIETLARACLDGLYGDAPHPTLAVTVDPDLVLTWECETIVVRILHEALRDAHRREAGSLDVHLDAADAVVVLRVVDDGTHPTHEAVAAAMWDYASWLDGDVAVVAAGAAVVTTARLRPATAASGRRPPVALHLVPEPQRHL
jgi:hypothetical protein